MLDAACHKTLSAVIGRIGYDVVDRPLRVKKINTDFPVSTIIQIRAANGLPNLLQHAGHGAIAARALPNFAVELLIVDQCECCPSRRWEKIWPAEVSEPLHCRLEPAV